MKSNYRYTSPSHWMFTCVHRADADLILTVVLFAGVHLYVFQSNRFQTKRSNWNTFVENYSMSSSITKDILKCIVKLLSCWPAFVAIVQTSTLYRRLCQRCNNAIDVCNENGPKINNLLNKWHNKLHAHHTMPYHLNQHEQSVTRTSLLSNWRIE